MPSMLTTPLRPKHYWRSLLLFTLAALVVAALLLQFVAVPVISAYRYAHPNRLPVCCLTPSAKGLNYETVSTLQLQDGVQYRVLGTPEAKYSATAVEPSLEDGYIWLMQQSREESQVTLPA